MPSPHPHCEKSQAQERGSEMAARSQGQAARLPASYVLPDGTTVLIRAARPEDETRLECMFYRLSPETIYFYTFLPVAHQPHWAMRIGALAGADSIDRYALVALVNEEVIGVARYDRDAAPGQAEFALLVEDAWQRQGLGKMLMTWLIKEASCRRVSTFTARILGENQRALRLVAALFASVQARWESGECLVCAPVAALRSAGICGSR